MTKRTRRSKAQIATDKREAEIRQAQANVAHWQHVLAAKEWGSQYREVWEDALKTAQARLTALEATA